MREFLQLLRQNRNYRYTWMGQVVSEIGDNFNNIAVFALAMALTHSGLVVTGIMLARAIPVVTIGPLAGVLLDRFDRQRIMIASDLVRAVVALGFILALTRERTWLLYLFSALLMLASPFFTAGRSAILPTITSDAELHTANSLTQTTQWTTTDGRHLPRRDHHCHWVQVGFLLQRALLRVFGLGDLEAEGSEGERLSRRTEEPDGDRSCQAMARISRRLALYAIRSAGDGHRPTGSRLGDRRRRSSNSLHALRRGRLQRRSGGNQHDLGMRRTWLAARWNPGNWLGKRLSYKGYKLTVFIDYIIHGSAYILFSRMPRLDLALIFIGLSRITMALNSVMNYSYLLRTVENRYRGRVFATMEALTWSMMMISMMGAGIASTHYSPRTIGTVAGLLSSTTAIFWGWANWTGRLPKPDSLGIELHEIEVHGDPVT